MKPYTSLNYMESVAAQELVERALDRAFKRGIQEPQSFTTKVGHTLANATVETVTKPVRAGEKRTTLTVEVSGYVDGQLVANVHAMVKLNKDATGYDQRIENIVADFRDGWESL